MYENLETPRSFEEFVLTSRQAAENLRSALNLECFNKGDFAEVWRVTVRDAYAMLLAKKPDGTVKLPDGYTADTIDGEPQLDTAVNILNNLNKYLGSNIVWLAFNAAIENTDYELAYIKI